MILVDFNGTVVGQILNMKGGATEDLVRHTILNNLRMYSHKYKKQYGDMVIALDKRSWRKDFFPQYKHKRKETVKDNKEQFKNMYNIMDTVIQEIKDFLPYTVVECQGAEADDIIAVIAESTQQFGQHEDIMLISGDKDFIQLHTYGNITQYSPITKKFIKDDNPQRYIFDHILKGDGTDGIPNILSGDDVFVEGIRQSPLRQKKIDELWESRDNLQAVMTEDQYRNYKRNLKLVSLDEIPDDIKKEITANYEEASRKNKAGKLQLVSYLMSKNCRLLVECVDEF